MNGKLMLYIDQFGNKIWAKNVRDLQKQAFGGCIRKQFTSRSDVDYHTGYVVGNRWFTAYTPFQEVV